MLIISDLRIGYQNIPKVATTTMFRWLYECISLARTGNLSAQHPYDSYREHFTNGSLAISVNNLPEYVEPYAGHYRFALTRDPVRRFISMYSNRVVHHKELSEKSRVFPRLLAAGLSTTPEINVLVDRFDAYSRLAQSILHHARPMVDFLGTDLSVYQRIADIGEIESVVEDLKRHFAAQGLAAPAQNAPPLGRAQTGGPKLGLEVLNPYSFEKLLDYYRQDYATIPTVNVDATKDAYRKARDQAFVVLGEAVTAATIIPMAKERGVKSKVAAPLPGDKPASVAANVPRPKKSGAKPAPVFAVEYPDCRLVQRVRVVGGAVAGSYSGVVLLSPQAGEGFSLKAVTPSGEHLVAWGLPSPWLSGQFVDNPAAGGARFEVNGIEAGESCEIRLVAQGGRESWPVARFVATDISPA